VAISKDGILFGCHAKGFEIAAKLFGAAICEDRRTETFLLL
jgi:hypothetical protein